MGFERLFRGALQCYSTQFRLLKKVLQDAFVSPRTSAGLSGSANRVTPAGPWGRILARRSMCTSAQPPRDVLLFEHDRTDFFRVLSLFCGGQALFWTYLSHFAFTELRNTSAATKNDKGDAKPTKTTGLAGMWSFDINLGSSVWRYGFTLGCLAIGAGVVGLGMLYCRRTVSQVILHRGGKMVTVIMQSPLGQGRGRRLTMPLSEVACHAHRHETPSFIPLRVKGHKFYFLLDKQGVINNARLFDITVGAYRHF